jgi:hypothetical protein
MCVAVDNAGVYNPDCLIHNSVRSQQQVVNFLNELLVIDPAAVTALFRKRAECRGLMVRRLKRCGVPGKKIQVLSLLNGIFADSVHSQVIKPQYKPDGKRIFRFVLEPVDKTI